MTTPETPGREPQTIVELEQKRCSLRFGIGACTATGTPKCYQTYGTCGDKENYTPDASIKWRFASDQVQDLAIGDFSDAENIETNAIPCLRSVSTSESKINPGSILDGKSPFGVTGKVTLQFVNIPWDDHVGDFYLADRPGYEAGKALPVRAGFWSLFTARNDVSADMFLRIYDGYVGQSLAEMRQRISILDRINGPSSDGSVQVTGLDPFRLADDKKAEFPRTSQLDLYGDVSATTTDLTVFGDVADLDDEFGMDGNSYLRINDEILRFDGYTDEGEGRYKLSNVFRGALDTTASSHADQDKCQRAARFDNELPWQVVDYLLRSHTPMPPEFLNLAQWDAEGGQYIPTHFVSRTLSVPQPVKTLCGELCQQGLFNLWFADYAQKFEMLAIRPPGSTPVLLTDEANNLDGTTVTMDPDARLTRVAVFYDLKGPLLSTTSEENYRYRFTSVDDETESITGKPITQKIFAPWITSRSMAIALAVRLLIRYRRTPSFLTVYVDAKDRNVQTGTIADVETEPFITTEGEMMRSRWLVTGSKEVKAGHTYMLDLQTYEYIGKFATYMADGSPDYQSATAEQREAGGWYADDNGELSDGSEGYLYQ